ncbi:MAG TPA: hypothetical protein VGX25_30260 [Actinophytocola sp.]|uniref:hypothetical protein n=1 Tax=Actinophytocola sp. TaxID=1872138 RepID=UPI002DDD9F1E|nr:hypothetical protein [Actinophytocola sp.]HEV2783692.1 hypothetical protein [Actinophytocola sp.]
MTEALPKINPFLPPDWAPMRPLCPWKQSYQRDYYVSVDDTDQAFKDFTQEMDDPTTLLHEGRLALVTGDSGCGKTALVHRCADDVARRLDGIGRTTEIIDLTDVLNGRRQQPTIDARMAIVCDRLFGALKSRGALRSDAVEELASDRDLPDRVYPYLPDALVDGIVLVVLLPMVELADEVMRYAAYATERMLFLVESSLLTKDEVSGVIRAQEAWGRLIGLHVGPLKRGDVARYVNDRLDRHSTDGDYPLMSEETMSRVEPRLQSVAQLQRALYGTYKERLRKAVRYDRSSSVTEQDIVDFLKSQYRDGPGRLP